MMASFSQCNNRGMKLKKALSEQIRRATAAEGGQ